MRMNDKARRHILEALMFRIEDYERRLDANRVPEEEFWDIGGEVSYLRELVCQLEQEMGEARPENNK